MKICPTCREERNHILEEWANHTLTPPRCPICASEDVKKHVREQDAKKGKRK
jgi:hypothetical protein